MQGLEANVEPVDNTEQTEIATRFQRNGSAGAGGATVERGSVGLQVRPRAREGTFPPRAETFPRSEASALQDGRDPDRYDRAEPIPPRGLSLSRRPVDQDRPGLVYQGVGDGGRGKSD